MTVRRVVVTEGGAGKTMLLDELARRGYPHATESAREIIRERLARGCAPRPEPSEFAEEVPRRDIDQYRRVGERSGVAGEPIPEYASGVHFFDRSLLDALWMLDRLGILSARERDRHVTDYPYHHQSSCFHPGGRSTASTPSATRPSPSRCGFTTPFASGNLRCGYKTFTVPPGPVADRCDRPRDPRVR